jgi:dipeptide/tripeptide permease
MEIFERLAWYGFFAVSSLYITGSVSEGALGFTSEQRGTLQGIVPFILYLLPVLFGALGDRFGYKKTFIIAYSTLVPAYYLLGQFTTFGGFFIAFLFVAVGAAIFKPVVVGTVARTTDETNSSMGFGIFYMMVNVGGFVGPVVAGIVRVKYGWNYVFLASSFWIACNFIWLLFFYKEPTTEAAGTQKRSIKQVLSGLVEVLGNGRFFIMIFGILILFMIGGRRFTWTMIGLTSAGWIILNMLIDILLRARESKIGKKSTGLSAPMRVGNWKFALYLLILSGFWTSFNQIFLTHPEFIRDFVETNDMVVTARNWFGEEFARDLAAVNEDLLGEQVGQFVVEHGNTLNARMKALQDGTYLAAFDTIRGNERAETINSATLKLTDQDIKPFVRSLYDFKVRVPADALLRSMSAIPLESLPLKDTGKGKALLDQLKSVPAEKTSQDVIAGFLDKQVSELYPSESLGNNNTGKPYSYFSANIAGRIDSVQKARKLDEQQMSYLLAGVVFSVPRAVKDQAHAFAEEYRQVNPEYIINIDAGAIVIFQVLISWLIGFIAPLTAMVIGIVIAAVGIGMAAWTYTGWLVTLAITIFAFGEMIASPKSQEYVGRIAPKQKVAMYMGYYFWAVALGNIFGGRLSGELYGALARDAGRPDIMWLIFGGLGLITAVILIVFDRTVLRKGGME